MTKTMILVAIAILSCVSSAEAKRKSYVIDPMCNITMPCQGVISSPRGEMVVKAMGGFGVAKKIYVPSRSEIVSHPQGCPSRAFCGCGAAVRVFGHSVRELWLAANWFRFPRTAPASGMVAVRRHHVFVLEADLGGGVWQVFDANSGDHLTRVHARSIAGYAIVNPRG